MRALERISLCAVTAVVVLILHPLLMPARGTVEIEPTGAPAPAVQPPQRTEQTGQVDPDLGRLPTLETLERTGVRELTPELIEQCLEVAQEIDPAFGQRLRSLCDHDAAAFEDTLRTTGRRIVALAVLRQHDRQLYDLRLQEMKIDAQVNQLARSLRKAIALELHDEAERIETELRAQVQKQVAVSIAARGVYLQRLEEHVRATKAAIEREAQNFVQTVEARMHELKYGRPPEPTEATAVPVERQTDDQ